MSPSGLFSPPTGESAGPEDPKQVFRPHRTVGGYADSQRFSLFRPPHAYNLYLSLGQFTKCFPVTFLGFFPCAI